MSSRIVINGKVRYGTPDARRLSDAERVKRDLMEFHVARNIPEPDQDGRIPAAPDYFAPIKHPYILPRRAGEPIQDEDGVYFRLVHKLDLSEGWCTAEQLTEFYEVPYEILREWALRGFVDTAMEKGSQVKRFRVPDHKRCKKLARDWKKKAGLKKPRMSKSDQGRFSALLGKK